MAGCGGSSGDGAPSDGTPSDGVPSGGSGSGSGGSGPGGSGPGDAGAGPENRAAPTLLGTPATLTWEGEDYDFAPSAADADGDALVFSALNVPTWASLDSASGRLAGTPSPADVGMYRDVRIRVSDGLHETWLPPFDIRVDAVSSGSVTLTWTPPSENVDDSVLDNLAGFVIYRGSEPAELELSGSIPTPGVTSHFLSGLEPGLHYFALTAINADAVESDPSDYTVIRVR